MAKKKKEESFDFVDSEKLNYRRFTGIYYCNTNSEAIDRLIADIHNVKHIEIKKQLAKVADEIREKDVDTEDFALEDPIGFVIECFKQKDDSRYVRYNTTK
jgi:hypothetical protein